MKKTSNTLDLTGLDLNGLPGDLVKELSRAGQDAVRSASGEQVLAQASSNEVQPHSVSRSDSMDGAKQ